MITFPILRPEAITIFTSIFSIPLMILFNRLITSSCISRDILVILTLQKWYNFFRMILLLRITWIRFPHICKCCVLFDYYIMLCEYISVYSSMLLLIYIWVVCRLFFNSTNMNILVDVFCHPCPCGLLSI